MLRKKNKLNLNSFLAVAWMFRHKCCHDHISVSGVPCKATSRQTDIVQNLQPGRLSIGILQEAVYLCLDIQAAASYLCGVK